MASRLWIFEMQLFSAWVMVGIIWFVQVVHYPLLRRRDPDDYGELSRLNQKWTTYVVGPPMLIEAVCAVLSSALDRRLSETSWYWTASGLLVVIWLSTALLLVPLHRRLLAGFDAVTVESLVRRNWVRTLAWTARAAILTCLGWSRNVA
jgi:hypothetical protein